ncbi:similar to An13g00270 [Aspergillus luchuensis]|nr:similar to An13g00270 [Aspergillus luchuensis IFO 4308]GAT20510.1 similar to An13g00270 [Aspergillus luchuensis]
MESLYSKRSSQIPFMADHAASDAENDGPLFDQPGAKSSRPDRRESIQNSLSSPVLSDHLDPSIAAHARLAAQYEKAQPVSVSSTNKVMTPSQFEHYRQQQELRRSNSDASKSENSAESDYDDDDEVEKDREAERQRRKQEAHLSVYRQQMMKVTGQESPAPAMRTEMDQASKSAPNLLQPGITSGSGKSSDGDDDEEIPLGILAAHGFPNRNRPPSRLAPSSSIPNLRASFQQPYLPSPSPASVAERDPNNRGSLPVFARNLPRDPYFGASLVNQSNRESLAFGGGASVHGGPSPALPPGGLVGVIATEERARAMRRGSPNTQAMYDYQGGMPVPPVQPGGIPRPYTMMSLSSPNTGGGQPAISATEQAQIELSQQMTQMVQMQMQWMQQMIHMQGGQSTQLMPPGGPPPALGANLNARPSSMPSAGNMSNAHAGYSGDQRTLSMLDPNVSSRLNSAAMPHVSGALRPSTPAGQGYAPSIAPSERSNVGLAPRYRPVSTLQPELGNIGSSSIPKSWNDENRKSSLSAAVPAAPQASQMSHRPMPSDSKPIRASKPSIGAEQDDEDDDEGWAEMMKKRENKRNNWKMKKETSSFGDLLNAVH